MQGVETETEKKRIIPTVSEVLEDGTVIEMVYQREHACTRLAMFNAVAGRC